MAGVLSYQTTSSFCKLKDDEYKEHFTLLAQRKIAIQEAYRSEGIIGGTIKNLGQLVYPGLRK